MKRILVLVIAVALSPVVPAFAQSAAPPARKSPAKQVGASAKPAAQSSGRKAATAPGIGSRTSTTHAAASTRTGAAPRRLEDIHIEGEIPAPQVLFITARDQRRFLGSQHRRFLRTARELGEATPLPSEVIITRSEPVAPKNPPATPEGRR